MLTGCNGKDTSKPRLVIDTGIMKKIVDDLEGGFGLGQGHSSYYYYAIVRVGVRREGKASGSSHVRAPRKPSWVVRGRKERNYNFGEVVIKKNLD